MTQKPVLKDRKPGRKRLALSRETLRELTPHELDGIASGSSMESDVGLVTTTRDCAERIL
jgi:hypothetical protein